MRRAASALLAGAALLILGADHTGRANAQTLPPVVEPVVLIDAVNLGSSATAEGPVGDRRVRGCGVRATFPAGPVLELVNMRVATRLELELVVHSIPVPSNDVVRVSIETSGETTAALLPQTAEIPTSTAPAGTASAGAASSERGRLGARGEIDPDAGARLFQQLMIGGAALTIERRAGSDVTKIPGPLPHTVRQAFLNCSGDLFPRTR